MPVEEFSEIGIISPQHFDHVDDLGRRMFMVVVSETLLVVVFRLAHRSPINAGQKNNFPLQAVDRICFQPPKTGKE